MSGRTGIILIGAGGRMGKTISGLIENNDEYYLAYAVERPEAIHAIRHFTAPVTDKLETALENARGAVIVDFSGADSSMATAAQAVAAGACAVIGSTGFTGAQKLELERLALKTPLLWSANMSVGINALEELLPRLVKELGNDYDIEIMEIHHRHKKDAPSGTALMLGEALARARGHTLDELRRDCRSGITGPRKDGEIGLQAVRGGEVAGVHTIWFFGPSESIEISHRADSRESFARGALRAAAWLRDRQPGKLYSMRDVLDEEA